MIGDDEDLLARLNRLKASSVALGVHGRLADVDVEAKQPVTKEDALAERLKSLRSGGVIAPGRGAVDSGDAASNLIAKTTDEARAESQDVQDWQHELQGEQSLEELLEELGREEQWSLDPNDPKHTDSLLTEAKEALPAEDGAAAKDAAGENFVLVEPDALDTHDGKVKLDEAGDLQDQKDEEEANEYVKQVLAELEIGTRHGERTDANRDDQSGGEKAEEGSAFDLPSTPSHLPNPAAEPPTYEDSELEARFAGLALNLPSTPTSAPSSRKSAQPSVEKPSLPKYTDEDIDSWCCICNENGDVKCLGCDGDVYCNNCWREGHGSRPGQESGHRAVQYSRGGDVAG